MNSQLSVKAVPFMGDELMAAKDEKSGKVYAGVSYICKGIGFDKNLKDAEVKRVQRDIVLKRGCVKFDAGVFDPNNEAIAIDNNFIPLWLAKIRSYWTSLTMLFFGEVIPCIHEHSQIGRKYPL